MTKRRGRRGGRKVREGQKGGHRQQAGKLGDGDGADKAWRQRAGGRDDAATGGGQRRAHALGRREGGQATQGWGTQEEEGQQPSEEGAPNAPGEVERSEQRRGG